LGNALLGRFSVASSRAAVRLPGPTVPAPAVSAGTDLRIPGLTPFMTSNASFYRVDTDLVLPQVSPETWTLTIDGMVDRPASHWCASRMRSAAPTTATPRGSACRWPG